MEVKSLATTNFNVLMDCFLEAFQNYYVEMPTDHDFYKNRWEAAEVSYNLSYGVFDNNKLVGFIINAIDNRGDDLIAFNTGTGVVPAYRGRRLVKLMYDHAFSELRQHGITKCALEVIKGNEIAIKSYRGIGFEVCKDYKCFNGTIAIENTADIELKEVDYKELKIYKSFINDQVYYSWDNHINVIEKGGYNYYLVLRFGIPDSYIVMNPTNGYIAQFGLLNKDTGSWERLFLGIKQISDTIKINNVDERLTTKINYLNTIGLQNSIDQYEMELKI